MRLTHVRNTIAKPVGLHFPFSFV